MGLEEDAKWLDFSLGDGRRLQLLVNLLKFFIVLELELGVVVDEPGLPLENLANVELDVADLERVEERERILHNVQVHDVLLVSSQLSTIG